MSTSDNKVSEVELHNILQTYLKVRSTRKAAEILGMSRSTFRRRLTKAQQTLMPDLNVRPEDPSGKVQVEETSENSSRVVTVKGIRTLQGLVKQASID